MPKEKLYRAGVIPYIVENDEIKMMFMVPSDPKYGTDKPQIAKGKIEENETSDQAALREGGEELGLFSGNINNFVDLGTFMGRTTVFVASIAEKEMFGDPHFETKEVHWLTLKEFEEKGRDLHVPVVKAAHRRIMKLEQLGN